jgi:hypothetical protein
MGVSIVIRRFGHERAVAPPGRRVSWRTAP